MGRGLDWIDLVRNRDSWRAIVDMVMNFRILCIVGNFYAS